MLDHLATAGRMVSRLAGSFFFIGYMKPAPGTWGSLAGAIIWWWALNLPIPIQLLIIIALLVLGVWAGSTMAADLGRKDPSEVVIDEVVGMWLTLFAMPHNLLLFIIGFVLFRLFDIWKPGPVGTLQNMPGGWGIMADDVLAGLISWVILMGIVAWL